MEEVELTACDSKRTLVEVMRDTKCLLQGSSLAWPSPPSLCCGHLTLSPHSNGLKCPPSNALAYTGSCPPNIRTWAGAMGAITSDWHLQLWIGTGQTVWSILSYSIFQKLWLMPSPHTQWTEFFSPPHCLPTRGENQRETCVAAFFTAAKQCDAPVIFALFVHLPSKNPL